MAGTSPAMTVEGVSIITKIDIIALQVTFSETFPPSDQ
jgi:hypothetical protein